jgi:hypothetical protein
MHVKKSVGKPDAGDRHVRFDERGDGNGLRPSSLRTAPLLDSTLGLNNRTQPRHHRPGRFLFHQLGVTDLAGGIIQDHDQVVPTLVAKPAVLAAINVQHHSGKWSPLPAPPVFAPPLPPGHQTRSLQCLLHPRVAQLDAMLVS